MAIDFNLLQPVDIGGQFLAGMQAGQEQRLQQQQQAEKLARAQRMRQDIATWQKDMSPERTAGLLMNYPEIKDQIVSSQAVLNDAAKRDRLDFSSRALMLSRAGQKDRVMEMAQQRIDAYRNAGKDKEAAEAEAMLKAYQIDPRVGEGALALDVATLDPKLYENLFGKAEMTPDEKRYEAIARKNGPAAADAWWNSQITKEKLVIIPGRGAYRAEDFGGENPESLPRPQSAADRDALPDGARYLAPNGQVMIKGASALSGVPAPGLDASGKPTILTRAQYQAVVQTKGKAKTDAWLRANNITVSDM